MRRRGLVAGFLVGIVVGLLTVTIAMQPAASSESEEDLMKDFFQPLAYVVREIQQNYVEEVKAEDLLIGAYQGMLSKLDKYSAHMPAEMYKEFRLDTKGKFGGLGIQIRFLPLEKVVFVEQPIPGTPAFNKRILAGDKIIRIKEESTGKVVETSELDNVYDAVKILRGEPGSKVTITVVHKRAPNEPEDITITRGVIKVPAVGAVRIVDDNRKVGYIYLTRFTERTLEDLDKALEKLREQGMRALVLDVRFNPGGLLSAATEVADRFLAEGVLVSTKGRSHPEKAYEAQEDEKDCLDIPLVVLVNSYSASASEIVAGAIRDRGRGIILGEHTYGKASVQHVVPLPDERGALKLTTAHYYTPSGACIEKVGIKPDIPVKLTTEEHVELAAHLSDYVGYPRDEEEEKEKQQEEKQSSGEKNEPASRSGNENGRSGTEEPYQDVQLQRAVDVLSGILVQDELVRRRQKVAVAGSGD